MKDIRCRAAVAVGPNLPLEVVDVLVEPPKTGEVRLKVIANALCHTDLYTLNGHDSEGRFPSILGHEATAIVESVGEGVYSVECGDYVVPCYTPECQKSDCIWCQSDKTNLCAAIRSQQGKGLMPDGTSRFRYADSGQPIYHFMGCSTFSEYTVVAEISVAKISKMTDMKTACLIGCGVTTGWGAVEVTADVRADQTVAIWGLGAVGLAVAQAAARRGARRIYGFDTRQDRLDRSRAFGVTDTISMDELTVAEPWGVDQCFDCTGNVNVMRTALERSHRGWGKATIVGVAAAGQEVSTRPFQFVTGRHLQGTAFGGIKSRSSVPRLVNEVTTGVRDVNSFVTGTFDSLECVNEMVSRMNAGGDDLRMVLNLSKAGNKPLQNFKLTASSKSHGGSIFKFQHESNEIRSVMSFSLFLPHIKKQTQKDAPLLVFLGGIGASDENSRTKSGILAPAARHGLAVLFPDTSPRHTGKQDDERWWIGDGASFYLDATNPKWESFKMESYIMNELIPLITDIFPIDGERRGICGFSMGGNGALTLGLRHQFNSVSAFSPITNPTGEVDGPCSGKDNLVEYQPKDPSSHDVLEVLRRYDGVKRKILIHAGTSDPWRKQLAFDKLSSVRNQKLDVQLVLAEGYDHSYFFVESFIEAHVEFHSRRLNNN